MRLRLRWRAVALVLTAVVLGYVVSELRLIRYKVAIQPEYEQWMGLESDGVNKTLRNPATLNSVVEGAYDTDGDSIIDLRTVTIFKGEVHEAIYEASGIDESGNPYIVEMTLAIPPSSIRSQDDNQDGFYDWITIHLSDHKDGQVKHSYADFNLDGLLDRMEVETQGKETKTYVLVENVWRLTKNKEESSRWTQWIHDEGTELQRVEFDGSKWVRADDLSP